MLCLFLSFPPWVFPAFPESFREIYNFVTNISTQCFCVIELPLTEQWTSNYPFSHHPVSSFFFKRGRQVTEMFCDAFTLVCCYFFHFIWEPQLSLPFLSCFIQFLSLISLSQENPVNCNYDELNVDSKNSPHSTFWQIF